MDEERRRILQMLTEGTISVDECDELLRALSERRIHKAEKEVQAAKSERRVWPYVMLGVLGLIVLSIFAGQFSIFGGLHVPLRLVPLGLLVFVFWIWMLVDCLARPAFNFRLLFTENHEHEKWIWIGIIALANWVGALVYAVLIRRMAGKRRADTAGNLPATKSEDEYVPWPRAKPLSLYFANGVGIGILLGLFLPMMLDGHRFIGSWGRLALAFPRSIIVSIALVLAVQLVVLHFWMLIDCIARDRREFGTLMSSEKSLDKVLWFLLIFFVPILGDFGYHLSVRRRIRPEAKRPDTTGHAGNEGTAMKRNGVVGVGLIVAAAALALGGCISIDTESSWNAKYERTETLSAAVEPGMLLAAITHNGPINVTGEDRADCSITATITAWGHDKEEAREFAESIDVYFDESADKLSIKADCPESVENWGVALRIAVPQDMPLELRTHNGSVTLSDLAGEIKGETHNGEIDFSRLSGDLDLTTHNGTVTGLDLLGNIQAKTHNGRILIYYSKDAPAAVKLTLETHNGGIKVTPPPNLSAVADISTRNGKIYSKLPLSFEDDDDTSYRGTIGEGEGLLMLKTYNGSIELN